MNPDSTFKPIYSEKDYTGFDLGTNLWTAVILFVMLVLQQIFLPIGWEFDMNSPEFNPLVFLPLLLISTIMWNLGKGAILWSRLRRFGTATMELHGRTFPVPGGICRGVVYTAGPIAAEGDFQLTMSCVEAYRFRRAGEIGPSDERYHSTIAWEKTLTIPHINVDPQAGLPFEYQLPEVAPLAPFIEPVGSGDRPYFKMKASIRIPGMKKRVITKNQKPDQRSWWLEVTAPTRDGKFCSKFQVPVENHTA